MNNHKKFFKNAWLFFLGYFLLVLYPFMIFCWFFARLWGATDKSFADTSYWWFGMLFKE